MIRLVISRIGAAIPVIFIVAAIVNLALYLSPGDPAAVIAGELASAQDVERIRTELGLNAGFFTQFTTWLGHAVRGDLGRSIFFDAPVSQLIGERLGPTAALASLALLIAIPFGVGFGIRAAHRPDGPFDRFVTGFSVAGFSVPVFVLGYVLVFLFAVKLQWLPVQGYVPLAEDPAKFVSHLLAPAIALAVTIIAFLSRMTRAAMMGVLEQDYIRTARAKGLPERTVLARHALKNAAMPIVTTIAASVAMLISGVVITETVFSIPGLGRLVVDAILQRDYPIIQGATLFFSCIYLLINLLVDIAYVFLDPRVKY